MSRSECFQEGQSTEEAKLLLVGSINNHNYYYFYLVYMLFCRMYVKMSFHYYYCIIRNKIQVLNHSEL